MNQLTRCTAHTSTLIVLVISMSAISLAADPPNYEQHVKPILRDHCLSCHNADEANADLDLSSFSALMKGGSSGVIAKAGRPDSSQLYRAITHAEGVEAMPPESPKMAAARIAVIQNWIRGGLIPGQGGKSQLRTVGMAFKASATGKSPLPSKLAIQLTKTAVQKTVRPPVAQALATSPGAQLIAVSGQQQILLFGRSESTKPKTSNAHPIKFLGLLPFDEGNIHDLKFSRSGTLLLAAGGRGAHSGRVVLFDVESGTRVAEIGDEVDSILAADISTDHETVALGGPSKLVKLYATRTGKLVHKIEKHTDWITSMAFSPNGEWLATGDRSGGLHVWETKAGAIVFTLDEHKVRITDLAWRADGKLLASAAEDGNVILWDMKDGWPARNIAAHARPAKTRYRRETGVLSLDFAADGRLLSTGRDGIIRVWTVDGNKTFESTAQSLPVSGGFLANSQMVVTGHMDGQVLLTDLTTKTSVSVPPTASTK